METGWRLYVCTVKQPRKCMAVFLKRLCLLKFMSWKTSHTVFVKDFCLNFQILIWLFFLFFLKYIYIYFLKTINNQRVLLLKVCCLVLLYQIRFSGSCFLILIFILGEINMSAKHLRNTCNLYTTQTTERKKNCYQVFKQIKKQL